MRIVKLLVLLILFGVTSSKLNFAYATYDPNSVTNNKFGIHILFPAEINEAANLVNSSGGDWGYVTIPIKASDKNIEKWQNFMDDCKKHHLIPIVRLATDGDYFSQSSWSKPTNDDIVDFTNFLDSLSWPTQNRYVVIYNEVNRADEWGGAPNASEYAGILDFAVRKFKSVNPDFFIISAGLDNASINALNASSINEFTYMYQMNDAVPGIFSEIDGLGSHSYPNPGFSAAPSAAREGVDSFYYQNSLVYSLTGKILPVFITETGWSSDTVSYALQVAYYNQTLREYWDSSNIVAITPFILNAGDSPFAKLSFFKNGVRTLVYKFYENYPKLKGQPLLASDFSVSIQSQNPNLPIKRFKPSEAIKSIFQKLNVPATTLFKWLLGA